MSLPIVTRVDLSAASGQAVVTLSNGDRHAFTFSDLENATKEIRADAESGSLAFNLDFYEGDTQEELEETLGAATDWTPIYEAQA